MRQFHVISFSLGIALCISSCSAVPHGKSNGVAASLIILKNLARMSEKSLATIMWLGGKSILCCARYPRLTIAASAGIVLSYRPARHTIGDYSYRYLVASLSALSNKAQSAVRTYMLGSLPDMVTETHASVEGHTQKLQEMVDSLQLLQQQCGIMQSSLDRVETSAQEHQDGLLSVQKSCDAIKDSVEEHVGKLNKRLDLIQENQQQQLNFLRAFVEHNKRLELGKPINMYGKEESGWIYQSLRHLLGVNNG